MFPEQITFADQMRYINKPIEQLCRQHQKQAKYFCSKDQCQNYTFLCQYCKRNNAHTHVDQIQDLYGWIKAIVQKIKEVKNRTNRILQSQYEPKSIRGDFQFYLLELKRVLSIIEGMEQKITETIKDSKLKIISYIRKYQNFGQSRLSTFAHLYTNPFVLVNKVNSERNDDFVMELKKMFRGESAETIDSFNPKYELLILQGKLKTITSNNNTEIFNLPKQTNKLPEILVAEKMSLQCESKPEKVFSKGEILMVGFRGFTQLVKIKTKQLSQKIDKTFSKCSSLIIEGKHNFIGINNLNNNELYISINKKQESIVFDFKIYSILLYLCTTRYYCILGRDQGKIVIVDIQSKNIVATLQEGHNSKVQFLQPWASQLKLLACGKNTPISVYKITTKNDQVSLTFQQQLKFPLSEIQQFQTYGSFLIMLTTHRNIYVYDLVLRLTYKTSLKEYSRDFDMLSVIEETETHLVLVTHNQGENTLYSWIIQKQRPQVIKIDQLYFASGGQVQFQELNGNDVWLIRMMESQQRLINFNLLVT